VQPSNRVKVISVNIVKTGKGNRKMRKKLVTLLVISLFALTLVFSTAPAKGAAGDWITSYTVRDLSTGEIKLQKSTTGAEVIDNLLEGVALNVTFTITVPMTVPDSTLTLTTNMQHAITQDRYWELKTTAYPVVDYNPNQQTVVFSQSQGNLTIACYGIIPTGLTTSSTGGGAQTHKPFAFTMVKLSGPSGEFLDEIKSWIIDDKIAEYNDLLGQSQNSLQQLKEQGVAAAYSALYENVIAGAEAAADVGFIDNAISQLNQLAITESPPVATGTSMFDTLFLPVAGALAAVAIIIMVLFFRARGKAGYVSQVVEDQIRDLEGLTLRASKVDKTLSSGLETIEDRLKRAVGA
jgi:hypothetical protein